MEGGIVVIVHIWNYLGTKEAWGHAAVEVTGGDPAGSIYVSWWPSPSGRQPYFPRLAQLPVLGELAANIYFVPAVENQTKQDDEANEGEGGDPRKPDHSIPVKGLNETEIKAWWTKFKNNPPPWSSVNTNCALIAAFALRAGGAEKLLVGFKGWWRSWNTMWSPSDVLLLAHQINYGFANNRPLIRSKL
jgi:hypothetical protein